MGWVRFLFIEITITPRLIWMSLPSMIGPIFNGWDFMGVRLMIKVGACWSKGHIYFPG
jgi:hypothetical protein